MKKTIAILALLLTGAAVLFAQQQVVAIPSFRGPVEQDAVAISDIFGTRMAAHGQFKVLTRTSLDVILDEAEFQQSGITDDASAMRLGQLSNADYVVSGNITAVGNSNLLIIQIIEMETAAVMSGSELRFNAIDEVLDRMDDLVGEAVGRMTGEEFVRSDANVEGFLPLGTWEKRKKTGRIMWITGGSVAVASILLRIYFFENEIYDMHTSYYDYKLEYGPHIGVDITTAAIIAGGVAVAGGVTLDIISSRKIKNNQYVLTASPAITPVSSGGIAPGVNLNLSF